MNPDICECCHFDEGDWVVCKLNSAIFGIVVGEGEFGRLYNVQLVDTLEIKAFHGVTLRHLHDGQGEPPTAVSTPVYDGNVVYPDFGKKTETKGAA